MAKKGDYDRINPFVTVHLSGRRVHRTKTIRGNANPIWTIQSHSLCVLEIPANIIPPDDDDDQTNVNIQTVARMWLARYKLNKDEREQRERQVPDRKLL